MLMLTRKPLNEGFRDNSEIVVTVPPSDRPTEVRFQLCDIVGNNARIGVSAPRDCEIMRPDAIHKVPAKVG